jgi:hypothetical protein
MHRAGITALFQVMARAKLLTWATLMHRLPDMMPALM